MESSQVLGLLAALNPQALSGGQSQQPAASRRNTFGAELTADQVKGLEYLQRYAQAGQVPSLQMLDHINAHTYPGRDDNTQKNYMQKVFEMFWNLGPIAQIRLKAASQMAALRSLHFMGEDAALLPDPRQFQARMAWISQMEAQISEAFNETMNQDPTQGESFRA